MLAARHAGERVWNTWAGRACQHGREVMDKRPLFEAIRVAWQEGEVSVVWVHVGSETQGSGLENVSVSCVQCQGPSNLQCIRQGEAGWEEKGPAVGKCL